MPSIPSESERRQATILFADISGFTSMSERLDAEEMTAIVNNCFALLGAIVAEHGGVIDKFIGDCVMALFGAPKALEGAPRKAIGAALKMRSELEAFNERRKLAIPLGIHIGINSGEVLSGYVGSAERQDFTVMGDTVNVASLIKDLADRGKVLVGPQTWRSAREAFRFTP
jgi:class 3 adenylate cyclase